MGELKDSMMKKLFAIAGNGGNKEGSELLITSW